MCFCSSEKALWLEQSEHGQERSGGNEGEWYRRTVLEFVSPCKDSGFSFQGYGTRLEGLSQGTDIK